MSTAVIAEISNLMDHLDKFASYCQHTKMNRKYLQTIWKNKRGSIPTSSARICQVEHQLASSGREDSFKTDLNCVPGVDEELISSTSQPSKTRTHCSTSNFFQISD